MEYGQVVDYSFARPSPQSIKAAGYLGVMRYLSVDAPSTHGKILFPPERDALLAAGLSIGLVWESTAGRTAEGFAAGVADAQLANGQADRLGVPEGSTIYYAVDSDLDPSAVRAYFMGAHSVNRRPVGVYGSYRVVEAILDDGTAVMAWQTVAWSHGQVSDRAVLYQREKPTHGPVAGTDENACLAPDWGQWPRPNQPPHPQPQEDEVLSLVRAPDGWTGLTNGLTKRHLVDQADVDATLVSLRGSGIVVNTKPDGTSPFDWPQKRLDEIPDA